MKRITPMKPILPIILSALSALIICGCKTTDDGNQEQKATNTYAVVVGMENSQFAGSCPGAGYDADRLYKLISSYTPNIVLYKDSKATRATISSALKKAVEQAGEGLVIFCYSGHGGSDPFPNTGIEETDGKDEYLCLWDTYMRDNEIWAIISQSKGRIFMITDSCHSQTQFRNPSFQLKPLLSFDHTLNESQPFSMLCWSGCPDSDFSYGASTGGQFTNALLRHYNPSESYQSLWDKIKQDRVLRSYENPQSTVIGKGFDDKGVFR